jgi:hypothetical protein
MERIRVILDETGFADVTVVDGRTARSVVSGIAAQRRLDDDADRAERDEYWWSGDVCWSNPRNDSHVVVPEQPHEPGLTFVVWGSDVEQTLRALQRGLR